MSERWHTYLSALALILACSSIYDLPYFLSSPFRPIALEVFGLTNTEAGTILGIYGFSNIALYLSSGYIADSFSPSRLILCGLVLTGLGGFYFSTIPSFTALCVLSLAWSISSIMIYWAAFVKSVCSWGGPRDQGWSWALIRAISSLVAAVKQALAFYIFSSLLENGEEATAPQKRYAVQMVIIFTSVAVMIAGLVVLVRLPLCDDFSKQEPKTSAHEDSWSSMWHVLGSIRVCLIACMLLSCYFCLLELNYFPQIAINGYKMSEVHAVWIGSLGIWVQPLFILIGGWFADRTSCTFMCAVCFVTLVTIFAFMGLSAPGSPLELLGCVILSNGAAWSMQSVFWSILQESAIPQSVTGAVVGSVSFIGFSADAFAPPVLGYLMDSKPGYAGNQNCLLVGVAFAVTGLLATVWLRAFLLAASKGDSADTPGQASERSRLFEARSSFGIGHLLEARTQDMHPP